MNVELIAFIVFVLLLTLFLYIKRKNVGLQKILFPVLYFIMYRTKMGLESMDKLSKKYPKFIKTITYVSVVVGFLGMIAICGLLLWNLYKIITVPSAIPGVSLVLPVQVKGTFYVPFFYWIISILLIATVHEFCHGVIARSYGLKIKSSGFAFLSILLPIIPAAFVEPDEDKLKKKPHFQQMAVFSAGPFANIVLGLVMLLLIVAAASPALGAIMDFKGATVLEVANNSAAMASNITVNETIVKIDNTSIVYVDDFSNLMDNKTPGQTLHIETDRANHTVVLGANPKDSKKPYLGITVTQNKDFKPELVGKYGEFSLNSIVWIIGLVYWLYLLNIGIGLFNLVPVGPIDGGRMAKSLFDKYFEKSSSEKIGRIVSVFFLVVIILNIVAGFIK